jgi:FlaA1/EpsC-like NDP-sugar epimerase
MKLNFPRLKRQDDRVQRGLIVGANARAGRLVNAIVKKRSPICRIEGFLDDDSDRRTALEELGVPYFGPVAALERLMIERVIDCVYVCLPLRSSYDKVQNVVAVCEAAGVRVFLLTDLLPLYAETADLWCMEPQQAGDLPQDSQEEPVSALQTQREESIPTVFTEQPADFLGLPSGQDVLPE